MDMVSITSLTGNGLKDWLIQRLTAVYMLIYGLCFIVCIMRHSPMEYGIWHDMFSCVWMKTATVIAVIAFSLHAWIGIWTVTTDYIKSCTLRLTTQIVVMAWLLIQGLFVMISMWSL